VGSVRLDFLLGIDASGAPAPRQRLEEGLDFRKALFTRNDSVETPERAEVPPRALALSLLALIVPVAGVFVQPDWLSEEQGLLLWVTVLVPPFLLTYYRGWRGASLGLAAGMAALVTANVLVLLSGAEPPDPAFIVWVAATYIAVCIGAGVLSEVLRRERSAAEEMALVDALTGIANRRHAAIFLDAAFSAAERGRPVCVVLFDLDRFKELNDEFGHRTGDAVLKDLGAIFGRMTRRMDLSARWGGEEFISILTNCRASGALVFADRVRKELRDLDHPWGVVTLSAGIAEFRPGMGTPDVLVATADRALYEAKDAGRDRCFIATGGSDDPEEAFEGPAPDVLRGSGRPDRRFGHSAGAPGAPPALLSEVPGEGGGSGGADLPAELPSGSERLFLVEDDSGARDSLHRVLSSLGYSVQAFPDAETALEAVAAGAGFDLLVTDLVLPGMGGFALADSLQERFGDLRVLYVSGQVRDGIVWWPGAPGTRVRFLSKPMGMGELAREVRGLLDEATSPLETRPV